MLIKEDNFILGERIISALNKNDFEYFVLLRSDRISFNDLGDLNNKDSKNMRNSEFNALITC